MCPRRPHVLVPGGFGSRSLVEKSQRPGWGSRVRGSASLWLLKEHRASKVNAVDRSFHDPAPVGAGGGGGIGRGTGREEQENRSLKLGAGRVVQMAASRGSSARGRWLWGGGSVGGGRWSWRLAAPPGVSCNPAPTPAHRVFLLLLRRQPELLKPLAPLPSPLPRR